jgi:hypothetical protein
LRTYQEIWEALKRDKVVSITANRLLHPRILKAVIKEKWMDTGFKIGIEPRRAILTHTRKHAVLTFYLELKLDYVTINDI